MSSKIGIVLVVVIVLIGVVVLMNSKKQTTSQATNTVAVSPTEVMSTTTAMSPTAMPSAVPSKAMEASTVTVTSTGFEPATLTVKAGTTVTWMNKSGASISINSNDHPTHLLYPPLNIGAVSDGATASLTFDKAGSFGYHNHFNPSQKAVIVVQ